MKIYCAAADWSGAVIFGLAVAVGLTPQMLPMIVTANLSRSVRSMRAKKTAIRRMDAIQNLGAMCAHLPAHAHVMPCMHDTCPDCPSRLLPKITRSAAWPPSRTLGPCARTCPHMLPPKHACTLSISYRMPEFWCSDWSILRCYALCIDGGFCCWNHLGMPACWIPDNLECCCRVATCCYFLGH